MCPQERCPHIWSPLWLTKNLHLPDLPPRCVEKKYNCCFLSFVPSASLVNVIEWYRYIIFQSDSSSNTVSILASSAELVKCLTSCIGHHGIIENTGHNGIIDAN